jgi:uncharacterized RDD family membrane protein YckC
MEEEYPTLSERIQSTFIDTILIIILFFVFTSVLDKFDNVQAWVKVLLFVALFIAYEPLCMTLGCTLGNYLRGIRVRKNWNSSKKINFFQAVIRYPVKFLLGWLSFLTIGVSEKRRAIHDIVSGSVVIKMNYEKDHAPDLED